MALTAPVSTIAASVLASLFLVTDVPLVPPAGFLVFLAWRLLQPGIWPLWAGFPLGLTDDLLSGQPLGSAALLWSLTLLALDAADRRIPWGDWRHDMRVGSALTVAVVLGGEFIVIATGVPVPAWLLMPQAVLAVLTLPLVIRWVAALDRWRVAA